MAGLESTKRAEFGERFEAFCSKHGFDYSRPDRLTTLTAAILNKKSIQSELIAFTQIASESPENMYAELMGQVAAVNGPDMIQFEPTLSKLSVEGDAAHAVAISRDGRKVPVPFSRRSDGWWLTEP